MEGEARVVKQHGDKGPEYAVFSASGVAGVVGDKHKYLFEAAFIKYGAADGLFEGCSKRRRGQGGVNGIKNIRRRAFADQVVTDFDLMMFLSELHDHGW